jgi:HSP20 family protein
VETNESVSRQDAQDRFNRFFPAGFATRIGSGEIHSLAVTDWSPEVDISEDDHGYLLKADLPEMKKDDVRVTVEDGILSVSGERKCVKEDQKKKSIASSDPLERSDAASRCLKMPIARK